MYAFSSFSVFLVRDDRSIACPESVKSEGCILIILDVVQQKAGIKVSSIFSWTDDEAL